MKTKISALCGLLLIASGCGKQAFHTIPSMTQQQAPGYFTIAPKIDIILAQDNSGSMSTIYQQVNAQMPGFLTGLETSGWNYHFISVPLIQNLSSTSQPFYQIAASHHDRNWGQSLWTPSFPGELFTMTDPGTVNPSFFHTTSTYTELGALPSNSYSGMQPGLEGIRRTLTDFTAGTGFLRQDSMLIVLDITNGEDTSWIKICHRSDATQYTGPCEQSGFTDWDHCGTPGGYSEANCHAGSGAAYADGTLAGARAYYADAFQKIRPIAKVYSASAPGRWQGGQTQYSLMAAASGGATYNINTTPVSAILDQLHNDLQSSKIAFRTRYLMLNQEPNPDTIQVVKNINGDATQSVAIPMDPVNGWTYAGYQDGIYLIDYPAQMNQATGYAIELHGAAKLIGNDTASITYKPAGGGDAVTQ